MGNFLNIPDPSQSSPSGGTGGDLIASLTDRADVFLFSYSPKIKSLISWSNNAEKILGVKDVAISRDGNLFLRHVHPDDRFLLLTDLEQALKGKAPYRATYRWIRPDNNEVRWLHCRAAANLKDNDQIFDGIIIDLSSEFTGSVGKIAGPDSVATILAAFPTMVFTVDSDLRLLRINRPRENFPFNFGDSAFRAEAFRIGRPILACFSDAEMRSHYEKVSRDILDGRSTYYRTRITVGETVYNLEVTPLSELDAIAGLLFIVADITEIVALERQLADLQKTEGLRLLAAGVAHNFNNALQSIIGQAAAMKSHPDKTSLVEQASQAIIDIVGRASDLTRQLFVFDDPTSKALVPVDLNLSIMAAVNRIEDLFSSGLKVAVAFGSPAPVLARQEPLSHAVEAILRNARESLSQGGSLSIKTYQVLLRDREVENLSAGAYAKLSISDSGQGMRAEARMRCFEPFFTTKERDPATGLSLKGEGLGLSSALNTIREFKGGITIESQAGAGTCVSIYLPIQTSTQQSAPASETLLATPTAPVDILLVDDDVMVLRTVEAILTEVGYRCAVAEDYTRALKVIKEQGKNLHLILLDAVMPGMDGATLLRQIRKLNYEVKVIGFSGAPPEHTQALLDAGALQILRKPVNPQLLKETVQQLLDTKQAA
ncbi:MAG: response regulator [Deltaproteobacteria bacterium]|nr:response regulator [Deltaproteobacteria bacterium]